MKRLTVALIILSLLCCLSSCAIPAETGSVNTEENHQTTIASTFLNENTLKPVETEQYTIYWENGKCIGAIVDEDEETKDNKNEATIIMIATMHTRRASNAGVLFFFSMVLLFINSFHTGLSPFTFVISIIYKYSKNASLYIIKSS